MGSATIDRHLARDQESELEVVRTDGSFLYDSRGRKYIDFVMGWCVGNFGWDNPGLERRLQHFRGPDYVYPGYSYKPWGELADLLVSIVPGEMAKCYRATGGSEAVDIALQAAMVRTGRSKFLSLEGSYHGNSIAGLSVGDSANREKYPNLLRGCDKIEPPLDENALDRIETRLRKRDVAAFIMEPISINLGVCVPPTSFMTGLQKLCRRYRTLLIMDEVATGFGRTGKLFASEYYDIEPDIVCVAKAITGGLGGMGAAISTADVADAMEEDGSFYSTYGWHPRSVDASIATLRYITRHQKRLLKHVAAISDYITNALREIDFKEEPTVRSKGLAIAVEFEGEDYAEQLVEKARRKRLLLSTEGSALLLLPALNIERTVAERALEILEECA